jgi:serine/threonine protein kinase
VWSLGIVFYIMLSGSMPFYADTPSEFLVGLYSLLFSAQLLLSHCRFLTMCGCFVVYRWRVQDLILTANVQFPEHEWAHISLEAKDLIVRMLCVEPIGRITVDQGEMSRLLSPALFLQSGLPRSCVR